VVRDRGEVVKLFVTRSLLASSTAAEVHAHRQAGPAPRRRGADVLRAHPEDGATPAAKRTESKGKGGTKAKAGAYVQNFTEERKTRPKRVRARREACQAKRPARSSVHVMEYLIASRRALWGHSGLHPRAGIETALCLQFHPVLSKSLLRLGARPGHRAFQ